MLITVNTRLNDDGDSSLRLANDGRLGVAAATRLDRSLHECGTSFHSSCSHDKSGNSSRGIAGLQSIQTMDYKF